MSDHGFDKYKRNIITAEMLQDKELTSSFPLDQWAEMEVGCEAWLIWYDDKSDDTGMMTRWPSGRGAIATNADSEWGDWYGDVLITDSGIKYDKNGDQIVDEEEIDDEDDETSG